jgi:hypothetical protein
MNTRSKTILATPVSPLPTLTAAAQLTARSGCSAVHLFYRSFGVFGSCFILLPTAKCAWLASIFNAMRTIYCVSQRATTALQSVPIFLKTAFILRGLIFKKLSLEAALLNAIKLLSSSQFKNNQVMQQLRKYVLVVFMIAVGATYCAAQATDTIELSVFNTGVKYRLIVATFGKPQTGAEWLTDMVLVHDTIMSYVATGSNGTTFLPPTLLAKMPDSLRRAFQAQKIMKPVVTTRCDKPITANVKDKVVLMELGTCDPSVMCLNAQNAGAKAVVLIHPSNNLDSILLKKGPGRDELKITCYTVTRATGTKIAALLPSHVGIKRRVVTPNQALIAQTNNGVPTISAQNAAQTPKNAADTEGSSESTQSDVRSTNGSTTTLKNSPNAQFDVSPNPSHDQTTLTYQFAKPTDATVEIETASGQVVLSQILRGATVGNLEIQTTEWANGTYILMMQYGKEVKTKKFVVQH